MSIKFEPRWSSAPGYTIRAIADSKRFSLDKVASDLQVNQSEFQSILDGNKRIDDALACSLSNTLGGSASFWIQRDAQYVESRHLVEVDEVARTAPIKDLIRMGWMRAVPDWQDQAREFLNFYEVADAHEWHVKYGEQVAHAQFRRSDKIRTDDMAVSAWLRRSDIEARSRKVADWSAEKFREILSHARGLSRIANPIEFIPRLQDLCSNAGVIVVVVKTPPGCPVSGAAFISSSKHPVISLSARHLSDDHFWFTFFHEAAHLLLHEPTDAPIIDELDPADDYSRFEEEANQLAVKFLMPNNVLELSALSRDHLTFRGIVRVASDLGIAPGVLVGLLQHEGIVGFEQKNRLKRRYRWVNSSLEMVHK